MHNPPRIAIIGAGPGGLTLARILHLHGIKASVFERDVYELARPQGWSLDMHAESGQFALQHARLETEFKRIARPEDQEMRIYDKFGTLRLIDTDVSEKDRPEVDREQLRQMLLQSLPGDVVQWDHALQTVSPQNDGSYELQFQNGKSETFDLVVGADGAWSRVRPLLSNVRPVYTGIIMVDISFDDVDVCFPDVAHIVGHGMMFALGDGKALIGHRDANAHIGVYAGLKVPEDWVESGGLDRSSSEATRNSLVEHFSDWSGKFVQLIRRCGDRITPRLIYALPVGHKWEHRPGVTLLGDAAHLMSPFSGEGANLAMLDAAELALALVKTKNGDWHTAMRDCETAMLNRAEGAGMGAKESLNEAFSPDGLSHLLEFMEGMMSGTNHYPGEKVS